MRDSINFCSSLMGAGVESCSGSAKWLERRRGEQVLTPGKGNSSDFHRVRTISILMVALVTRRPSDIAPRANAESDFEPGERERNVSPTFAREPENARRCRDRAEWTSIPGM